MFPTLLHLFLAVSLTVSSMPVESPIAGPYDTYEFPTSLQTFTAVENQAYRPDGSVLLTSYTNGSIWQISPPFSNPTFSTVSDFTLHPDVTATLGIVATTPDVFYVITSHFNSSFANFTSTPGSNKIYRLTFPGPTIEIAANVTGAKFLNGLTKMNDAFLLAADSQLGAIWGIDITTGQSSIIVSDETMAPYPALKGAFGNGINGLKLYNNWAYFTNTIRSSLGRVQTSSDGRQAGPVETLANFSVPALSVEDNVQPDDLLVLDDGSALVALRTPGQIARVDLSGKTTILADLGSPHNMTSLSFGNGVEQNSGKTTVFATGVFGRFFEVPVQL